MSSDRQHVTRPERAIRGEIDLESYDRLFPSQDFLPKKGFGNLIALPLQGACREEGNAEFLDPTTLKPWPDQWSYLSTVRRLSPRALEDLLASLPEVGVQWRAQVIALLGLEDAQVGQIASGKQKKSDVVDVAMIQSLKGLDLESFFEPYGLLVIDECHHLPAFSFEAVVKRAATRFVLGLTATPYRRDGLEDIIWMQCGPARHSISGPALAPEDGICLDLCIRKTAFGFSGDDETAIQEIFGELVSDEERNRLICKDVLGAIGSGSRCLVLSQRKEHVRALADLLRAEGTEPLVLEGSLRKKAREEVFEGIRSRSADEELLVIATGQYIGEGFDCPPLDTLFLAFPVSFKGRLVQYVGRLMRASEGKRLIRVYDYTDLKVPVLKAMHLRRAKTYKSLGFALRGIAGYSRCLTSS